MSNGIDYSRKMLQTKQMMGKYLTIDRDHNDGDVGEELRLLKSRAGDK